MEPQRTPPRARAHVRSRYLKGVAPLIGGDIEAGSRSDRVQQSPRPRPSAKRHGVTSRTPRRTSCSPVSQPNATHGAPPLCTRKDALGASQTSAPRLHCPIRSTATQHGRDASAARRFDSKLSRECCLACSPDISVQRAVPGSDVARQPRRGCTPPDRRVCLVQPRWGWGGLVTRQPRVRFATLGCVVERLRRTRMEHKRETMCRVIDARS